MTIYDGFTAWKPGHTPTVLAIGDSWFWYPRNNLLEALARHDKLKDGYQHMVRLGQNGALVSEYVDLPGGRPGKFGRQLRDLLRPDPMQYITVFLVSGAGNDAVDYRLALKSDCSGEDAPADCVDDAGMRALVNDITKAMSLLLHEVLWAFDAQQRTPTVLLHGYDYPVPDGRPFDLAGLPLEGPWLAPAMNSCQVPPDPELRKGIMHRLLDSINVAFARYAQPASGIHFVDSRNTLASGAGYEGDWANELHPTAGGFDRIVDRKWIPELQEQGIARD